jgi:hypothetical protein
VTPFKLMLEPTGAVAPIRGVNLHVLRGETETGQLVAALAILKPLGWRSGALPFESTVECQIWRGLRGRIWAGPDGATLTISLIAFGSAARAYLLDVEIRSAPDAVAR